MHPHPEDEGIREEKKPTHLSPFYSCPLVWFPEPVTHAQKELEYDVWMHGSVGYLPPSATRTSEWSAWFMFSSLFFLMRLIKYLVPGQWWVDISLIKAMCLFLKNSLFFFRFEGPRTVVWPSWYWAFRWWCPIDFSAQGGTANMLDMSRMGGISHALSTIPLLLLIRWTSSLSAMMPFQV